MKNKKYFFLRISSIFIFVAFFIFNSSVSLAAGINLIQNSSFEVANGNDPDLWYQAGYGNNDRVYSYNSNGVDGSKAISSTITTYNDGDAKWYFAPVPITAGHSYSYSDSYKSNVDTELVAEYFDASQNHLSYDGFISVDPSEGSVWGLSNTIFTPPTGASYMTVFHLIKKVGSLTIDNASLTEVEPLQSFDQGFVSLTFDDGLLSQFQNAFNVMNQNNLKGTFYIISHAIAGDSITNPSVDNNSTGWQNNAVEGSTYTYPSEGHTGQGLKVTSTSPNSLSGWFFNPITVLNDNVYSFSEWYNSTANSELVALVTKQDNSVIQADVVDAQGNTLGQSVVLSPTEGWVEEKANFYIPSDAKSVTVITRLTGVGDLSIDDVSFGAIDHMTASQILSLYQAGNDIGGHSQSHRDLTTLNLTDRQNEIFGNKEDLQALGLNNIVSFSYPYGTYNTGIQTALNDAGFTSGRSIALGYNGKQTNKYNLYTQSIKSDTTLNTIESWINKAVTDKTWLVLVFHDIKSSVPDDPYGTTIDNFNGIVNYLKTNNIPVKTVSEGIALMNNSTPTPVLTSITVTPSNPSFVVGATQQFNAVGYDQNNQVMNPQPTFTWTSSDTSKTTVSVGGLATGVAVGTSTITATNGSVNGTTLATVTSVTPPAPTLSSIAITTPATKLKYNVGDQLDITGLVVTGTYSDNTTKTENITSSNITGFNSGTSVSGQVLTITVGDKTTTYTIDIIKSSEGDDKPRYTSYGGYPIYLKLLKDYQKNIKAQEKAKYKFEKNLRKGITHEEIKNLQSRLLEEGVYSGPVTGYFGPLTFNAVVKYQSKMGLPKTGFVGPMTRKALNEIIVAQS